MHPIVPTLIIFPISLYRTQSLEESFIPGFPDTAIATAGTETISYDFSGNLSGVVQRIDRDYTIGEFWTFGRPQLEPINVSIIVRGGADGYACFIKGNEYVFTGLDTLGGYTDGTGLIQDWQDLTLIIGLGSCVYERISPRCY